MIELPQYVHTVTKKRKAGDRLYVFYTRHRNTPDAWPSITLPHPLDKEFARRHAICKALERDAGGFKIGLRRLPDPKASDFWSEAEAALKVLERNNHVAAKDFTALCDGFESDTNAKWRALSANTRRGYLRYGKMIRKAWGDDLPADLSTVDAQQAIDALGDTPASANQFRAYLSRLMSFGVPRGFNRDNPVTFTEKVPGGEPWSPWPEWAFEILFEEAPFHIQFICASALFTGQRQVDLIGMRPPQKGVIEVRAQKTGETRWIPVHSQYQAWVDRSPKASAVQMHVGASGLPYGDVESFRTAWQREMRKEAYKRLRDERIVFHGLRKNAVNMLLEVGCSEDEVGSICNMSAQMVRHYGRDASMKRLAVNAMKKMEAGWKDVAPASIRNGNGT